MSERRHPPGAGKREFPGNAPFLTVCFSAAARAVHDLGMDGFPASLVAVVRPVVEFDTALVLHYAPDAAPVALHDAFQHQHRGNDLDTYLSGAYLLDPFFIKGTREGAEGVYRLRDIVSNDFITSPYFRQYYKHSHVSDEVNLLVRLEEKTVLAISLERTEEHQPFEAAEIARLEALFPLTAELARADWPRRRARTEPGAASHARHDDLRERLARFGEDRLTPRERDVVQLLLSGYDTREVGEALGVAGDTVRVHRKNIYRKLEVSSIGELFASALDEVLRET